MKIKIPNQLQAYTEGKSCVSANGKTLLEVLTDLDRQFPGIMFRAIDEQDRIRKHIRIFLDGQSVDSIKINTSRISEIQIVGALSGG